MPMTRYTKDHLTQSLFYQLPKFLFVEPLKSTPVSYTHLTLPTICSV